MTNTEPAPAGLTFSAEDAPIVLEALEQAAHPHPQLAARAESLLARLSLEPDAEHHLEAEQYPDERRRLRTRLLYVLASTASPGQSDYETADVLAAMPGDVCSTVTRWIQRAKRPGGRRRSRNLT